MTDSESLRLPRTLAALEEGRRAGWHLGAQLHVVWQGRVMASVAVGERQAGEPLTPDTLLGWLSAGKPLTALAVAQQLERQRLRLDDPVVLHLPEWSGAGRDGITLRHLLTHSSGLRQLAGASETWSWEEWSEAVLRLSADPHHPPGTAAAYHPQATWHLLGEIVYRLDGRPLEDYLREEILVPLGMSDSWVGMPPSTFHAYGTRLGTTYSTFPGPPKPHPVADTVAAVTQCRPGSSARGPARELGRLYEALLDGGRGVVQPDTLAEFTRRHREGLFDATFRHVVDLGLGFIVNSNRHGQDTVPYGYGPYASDQTYGHSGNQCSCAFADPQHQLAVAWVCNGQPGEPRHQRRQRAINAAVYEDLGLA